MPLLQVKTVGSEQVWKSPDGQRKIYRLQLEYEGKPVTAKTYSDQIATEGWEGTVETYEKPQRNGGSETFVKQPPKEGASSGTYASSGGRSSGGSYQPKDEAAIKAMWAIGQAVSATGPAESHAITDWTANVEVVAQELFLMVDRVKVVTPDEATKDTDPTDDFLSDPDVQKLHEIFDDENGAVEDLGKVAKE